jgi:hypothetical protein
LKGNFEMSKMLLGLAATVMALILTSGTANAQLYQRFGFAPPMPPVPAFGLVPHGNHFDAVPLGNQHHHHHQHQANRPTIQFGMSFGGYNNGYNSGYGRGYNYPGGAGYHAGYPVYGIGHGGGYGSGYGSGYNRGGCNNRF